jgi:CheY-like chemotaxis protein
MSDQQPKADSLPSEELQSDRMRKGSVLIVDDDPIGRKLTALRFRGAGFDVALASSAEEALREAIVAPPDAIVSDVRMTGMDGFAFRDAMRADPRLVGIPVVLVSSAALAARAPGHEAADDGYLLRSADMHEVIAAVAAVLQTTDEGSARQRRVRKTGEDR